MSALRQVFRNTATGWISVGVRAALGLLLVPYLLGIAGVEGFGLISLLGGIVGLTSVIDLGLRNALAQALAEQVARRNSRRFNQLLNTALLLYLAVAMLLVFAGWVCAPQLVSVFNVSSTLHTQAVGLVRIYGCGATLISFIAPVFSAALSSYQRFDIVNAQQAITGIVSGIVLVTGLRYFDDPLDGWVVVMLSSHVLGVILLALALGRYCVVARFHARFVRVRCLVPLFRLGGYMYTIQLSRAMSDQADPLIISTFLGVRTLSIYQPAISVTQLLQPIVMSLASQLSPLATHYHVAGDVERMRKIFISGAKYTMLLGGLASFGLFFFADSFCRLWLWSTLGENYVSAATLLKLFAVTELLSYASGTQWPILLSMGRLKYTAGLLFVTALLNIAISIYLVGYTSVGVSGVLYGTIFSKLIRTWFLSKYVNDLLGVKYIDYVREGLWAPIICLIIVSSVSWGVLGSIECDSWLVFVALVAVVLGIWIASCWIFGLNSQDKRSVKGLLARG